MNQQTASIKRTSCCDHANFRQEIYIKRFWWY